MDDALEGDHGATAPLTLDRLVPHRLAAVREVTAAGQDPERARQMAELGFRRGETVMVVARAWPGHDPLVVRVGGSRFALRRAEAACVQVEPLR
jgi:ferrous iron transport protein A